MDIEKAKNDIIYFAENTLGHQLKKWQKDLLLKHQEGESVLWIIGNRTGKYKVLKTIKKYKRFTS